METAVNLGNLLAGDFVQEELSFNKSLFWTFVSLAEKRQSYKCHKTKRYAQGRIVLIAKFFSLFIILLVSSCGNSEPPPEPPSEYEIIQLFKDKHELFLTLEKEVISDAGKSRILKVDKTNIKPQSITEEKFSFYKKQLDQIPAQRVEIYKDEIIFTVFNHGMVFAGCSTLILHSKSGKPTKPEWANPYLLVDLGDNWYGETKCN